MPSSTRKERPNYRKQPQQHYQHGLLDDPTPPPSLQSSPRSPPHPYHENPPPPLPALQEPLQHRSSSSDSKLSDISMDDFDKNSVLDSVLEYSDTSDDMREDAYFLPQENPYVPPGSLLGLGNQYHHRSRHAGHKQHQHPQQQRQQQQQGRGNSRQPNSRTTTAAGESSFRELRHSGGAKSSKIVRFQPGGSSDSLCSEPSSIDNVGSEPSPSAGSVGADDESSPRSDRDSNSNRQRNYPQMGNWMKKVAYAFRSPSGIPHKKAESEVVDGTHSNTGRGQHTNESNAAHRSIPSGGTLEYPYSMIHLRDPSHTPTLAERSSNAPSAYETSPLLARTSHKVPPLRNFSGGGRGLYGGLPTNDDPLYRTSSKPPDFHPLKVSTTSGTTGMTRSSLARRNNNSDENNNYGMEKVDDFAEGAIELSRPDRYVFRSRTTAARVSAYFLMDYEASRPPTLQSDFETITSRQLYLYRIHFSWPWRWFVNLAILGLFLSHTQNRLSTAIMHSCVIAVFVVEIQMTELMYGTDPQEDSRHPDRALVRPMAAFLFLLGLESWMWYIFSVDMEPNRASPPLISSIFKPLVFFYVSAKARDSLEALWRISRIVARVLIIEFGLILTFSAVACRLFGSKHDSFYNLSTSWVSLFELSTTVVNPSLWMPMYQSAPTQAIFFVVFIITCVFYYHSLVLSVVFQTYLQAVTEIHERSSSDREDAVRLSFLALMKDGQSDVISTSSVRRCLQVVRPHYNTLKMKALLDIVDPSFQRVISYDAFRTKIRQALNASIRTARAATNLAMGVELIAVLVAVSNFIYVILVTSEWDQPWFDSVEVLLGSIITLLGLLELVIRFNPLRIQNFAPITRLNFFFDGLASVAAIVSFVGIVQNVADYNPYGGIEISDWLLMGRAIDMIRIMRFFPIFRDVVRRSADVLPAMAGPVILVLSIIHIFVYFGIAIWGNAIDVEALMENEDLTPLYCLNNFNSYVEGLVTVFNVMVVNDWHAIAAVYLYADRNSSKLIVYPFFVSAICISVFILLNVVTAFFVESFVTKRNDPTDDNLGDDREVHHRGFKIRTGENTNVKRMTQSVRPSEVTVPFLDDEPSSTESAPHGDNDENDNMYQIDRLGSGDISATSGGGELYAFDIYEREGFDNIMRTVAGATDDEQEAFARSVCNYLEIFESLSVGREKVGYMICCQQSMNRYGNHRFQTSSCGFLSDDTLHKVVSDMHSELLVLTIRKNSFDDRCLVRTFPHKSDPTRNLEITATLLRYQPAATLFVSRIRSTRSSSPSGGGEVDATAQP